MNGRAGGALLRLIAQFNLLPSLELHPDHRPDYAPAPLWQGGAIGRFGHRHLSAHILKAERLHGDWVTAFETRERRLALLGWRARERLIALTGIALNAHWIATSIDRDEVASLRTRLGRDDYAFAVGRARFLGLSAGWPAPGSETDRLDWIRRAGQAYVQACASGQPRALVRRLELRLARDNAAGAAAVGLPAVEPAGAIALFRKVAPEVGPECVSLLN
jgi:YOP proteins translocation protein K (YscK)